MRNRAPSRRDTFGINGIDHLSTGFLKAYPHSLWKTIAYRHRAQGVLPQGQHVIRLLKRASMRRDAFNVNGIAQLSTGWCSAYPHALWKTFEALPCSMAPFVVEAYPVRDGDRPDGWSIRHHRVTTACASSR
ncbi:hypothetical protein [Dyella sp. EPa41]|uniref:hypothetical protein n=1 Tax=Dyella sp. EPa41 TaxID=1561194 RepID=UPI0019156B02|nr:hypothetical protein [Dyella sp. EPa41]